MDRVLVIDKPAGLTSHDVVDRLRRSTRSKKVGHTGTLDPAATGVLVMLVGRATRLAQFLVDLEKEYRGAMILGVETDTQDSQGKVVATGDASDVTEARVVAAFAALEGETEQIPPMVSALKHEGKRLYALAREGIEVERKPRRVFVRSLRLTGFAPPEVEFEVVCSKGTYVRTLAADVGTALGCGAHLGRLSRTGVGGFTLDDALPLGEALSAGRGLDELGVSMFDALGHMPFIVMNDDETDEVANGGAIAVDEARLVGHRGEHVRMTQTGTDLAAVGRVAACASPGRISINPVRVFVQAP